MRSQRGQGTGLGQKGFAYGKYPIQGIYLALFVQGVQKTVPFPEQLLAVFAGMDSGGGVRQNGKSGCFGPGQILRSAGKISPRCGLKPHNVSSEGGVRSIKGKYPVLGTANLQSGRQDGLNRFLPQGPFLSSGHPYDLHRDGAASALDVTGTDVLHKSPSDSYGIHSGMVSEILVLELYEGGFVLFGNAVAGRKPPLPVIGDPRSEKESVPVIDDSGIRRAFEKVAGKAERIP